MKYRPNCSKMDCEKKSEVILSLPMFGPIYFCAKHGLRNIQWQDVIEMPTMAEREISLT